MNGAVVVLCGPSGAGKSTLLRRAQARLPELRFSVSYTTRPARPGEQHGVDYFFVTDEEFVACIGRGEFLEHAQVHGRRYGTHRAHVEGLARDGGIVLLDIDVQGARQVRASRLPHTAIFLLPPSFEELERRLRARGTESEEQIVRRLATARREVLDAPRFPWVLVNDELDRAADELVGLLLCARVSRRRLSNLRRFGLAARPR